MNDYEYDNSIVKTNVVDSIVRYKDFQVMYGQIIQLQGRGWVVNWFVVDDSFNSSRENLEKGISVNKLSLYKLKN